jgi:ribonuclease M5
MIQIKEAILVEGKYDVEKLRRLVDTVIVSTGGFRVFKDSEKLTMLRRLAQKRGLLILTDSDGAGFVIRNYLKGAIPPEQVKHGYIPEICGKEKRKKHASKEGLLGVEGVEDAVILQALRRAGATVLGENQSQVTRKKLKKADLYALGLSGTPGSEERRKQLLKKLALPQYLTANALLEFLNAVSDYTEIEELLQIIGEEN